MSGAAYGGPWGGMVVGSARTRLSGLPGLSGLLGLLGLRGLLGVPQCCSISALIFGSQDNKGRLGD